jgi:NitT/TauT family transport system permease protein/taurine transport system permease protein
VSVHVRPTFPAARRESFGDRVHLAHAWARVRRIRWAYQPLRFFGSFALLGLVWQLATFVVPPFYLPAPGVVGAAFVELVAKGILPMYVSDSVRHLLIAVAVALVIGIPAGLLIGVSRPAARFFYPLLNFFQSLSGIAWLPMMLVWFGFNELTIIVAINYTVLFPVMFNTLIGVRTVPPVYTSALRTMGAGRARLVRDVFIPGALPNIVTGVRMGIAYGWRALIAAEMLVGANGLGFMIFDAQSLGITARILLGMLVIGALWLFTDQVFLRPLETATVQRWGTLQA